MQRKKILDTVKFPSDLKKLTDNELNILSNELRQETISIVSQTGGHLGSSLGVIELTVAIHSVFNTPFDKLIWDVSHQCYPHKILTGRRKGMMKSISAVMRIILCHAAIQSLQRLEPLTILNYRQITLDCLIA